MIRRKKKPLDIWKKHRNPFNLTKDWPIEIKVKLWNGLVICKLLTFDTGLCYIKMSFSFSFSQTDRVRLIDFRPKRHRAHTQWNAPRPFSMETSICFVFSSVQCVCVCICQTHLHDFINSMETLKKIYQMKYADFDSRYESDRCWSLSLAIKRNSMQWTKQWENTK